MQKSKVKARAQALYYELRGLSLSHSTALSAVVDFVIEASVPDAPPAKPAPKNFKRKRK